MSSNTFVTAEEIEALETNFETNKWLSNFTSTIGVELQLDFKFLSVLFAKFLEEDTFFSLI